MENMKMRIGRERELEVLLCLLSFTEVMIDHASMIEEPGVPGPQLQGLRHGGAGLLKPFVLKQGPGQDVIGIDILSDLQLLFRQFQGLAQLYVVVRVEVGELAVIQDLVEGV